MVVGRLWWSNIVAGLVYLFIPSLALVSLNEDMASR